MRSVILALVLAPVYAACAVDRSSLGRPEEAAAPTLEAPPPPAEGPEAQALYQVLFEGELGAEAHALGQRARALAWFDAMAFTDEQLRGLRKLARHLERREATIAEAEAAAAKQELAALEPVYTELIPLLLREEASSEELAAAGTRLAQARKVSGAGTVHRVRHEQLRGMLDETRRWIETLDETQRTTLDHSRFLLRHRVGPLTTPGDQAALLGTVWDGAAFDTLVLGRLPTEEEPLDIGGLWAGEQVRNTPDQGLGGVQKQVLVLLAAREPGLVEAIAVKLGEREALDFSAAGAPPEDGSAEGATPAEP